MKNGKTKEGEKPKKRKYLMRVMFCGNPECFSCSVRHSFDPPISEKCFCGKKRYVALVRIFQRDGEVIVEKVKEGGEALAVPVKAADKPAAKVA